MTAAEMDRRIAEMDPKAYQKVRNLVRNTTYTAREIHAFYIPGTRGLAHINAVFQKVQTELENRT